MTHKRNTEGMKQSLKQKRLDALSRVKSSIIKLRRNNSVINFSIVSKEANVIRSFLYKEAEIKEQILFLSEESQVASSKQSKVVSISASEKSKDNIIKMLRQKLKDTEAENKKLKEQVELLYGRLCN